MKKRSTGCRIAFLCLALLCLVIATFAGAWVGAFFEKGPQGTELGLMATWLLFAAKLGSLVFMVLAIAACIACGMIALGFTTDY